MKINGPDLRISWIAQITKSIRIAIEDLGLERVAILYPGTQRFALNDVVVAVPLESLAVRGTLFNDPSD